MKDIGGVTLWAGAAIAAPHIESWGGKQQCTPPQLFVQFISYARENWSSVIIKSILAA